MGFIEGITAISGVLGIPSAFITVFDKIGYWVEDYKLKRNPERMHHILLEQFEEVQDRSLDRLTLWISDHHDEDLKKQYYDTLRDIQHETRWREYNIHFGKEMMDASHIGQLIKEIDVLREKYQDNSIAETLDTQYTTVFLEELSRFPELQRWYTNAIQKNLANKCDVIIAYLEMSQKVLDEIHRDGQRIRGNTDSILEATDILREELSGVNSIVENNNGILNRFGLAVKVLLSYFAITILGFCIVIVAGLVFHKQYDYVVFSFVPLCLLLSDILTQCFWKQTGDWNTVSFLISSTSQFFISMVGVIIIFSLASHGEIDYLFWSCCMLLSGFAMQALHRLHQFRINRIKRLKLRWAQDHINRIEDNQMHRRYRG